MPETCKNPLTRQIGIVQSLHNDDLANGHGRVYLPAAQSKMKLDSRQAPGWQYLFPSNAIFIDQENHVAGRHHIDETVMRKKIKAAIKSAGICKAASTHTLRHSFATECILNGMDIRTLQELMGHSSVSTTQIYLHVSQQKRKLIISPLDQI